MPPELDALAEALSRIVGADRLLRGEAAAGWNVDGLAPRLLALPATQEEVAAILAACDTAAAAVLPWGGGTAMALGNPPARLDVVIGLERLDRIVELDAANLCVTAEAGVRLGDLSRRLEAEGALLPLDLPRADRHTVGGAIAANQSGPSRLCYGTARDWVLGMRVALPDGSRIRAGGTVIKNVSGYDLNKLFIGSLGTLGIITEVTVKLLPAPARRASVVGLFAALDRAAAVVARALESHLLPEALELLNPEATREVAGPLALQDAEGYGLAVALAGSPETVERQVRDFTQCFRDGGTLRTVVLSPEPSRAAWDAIRLAPALAVEPGRHALQVRIGVPIARTAALVAAAEALGDRRAWPAAVTAHAGSGVVRAAYATGDAAPEGVAEAIQALRREAEDAEGSLVVEAAPPAVKARLDAWGSPGAALPVMRRLKAEFDPAGTLSPGRFVGGI
jgi:glycolate oxidase FAD binding subunit